MAQVVKDPKHPPKTLLLVGFLGEAADDDHTRLYLDVQLRSYVDVPNEAVLHSQEASGGADLSPSYLWVAGDAKLVASGGSGASGTSQPNEQGESNMSANFVTIPGCVSQTQSCVVCPSTGAFAAQAYAQPAGGHPYTVWPTLLPPTCLPLLCTHQAGGAAAFQPQATFPTIPNTQSLTIPILCCPLPSGAQAAGGANLTVNPTTFPTIFWPTIPPFCPVQAGPQAAGGHPYTVWPPTLLPPTCLPPLCGQHGGAVAAQAALPTIPVSQCLTIPVVCC